MTDPAILWLRDFIASDRPIEMFPGASLALGRLGHSPRDVVGRTITGPCEVVGESPEGIVLGGEVYGLRIQLTVRYGEEPPSWAEVRGFAILP